jgi:methionine-rich copper-binding protein CopC
MTDERLIYDGRGVPRPNPALPKQEPKDETEQLKGEVFEGRVVSYLLGQLSDEEVEQFEDECFAQESWPAQIEAIEDDLIDEYLHGELSPEQHQLFEHNYLTSEGRQTRVRTASALLRRVCEEDVVPYASTVVVPEKEIWAEQISSEEYAMLATCGAALERNTSARGKKLEPGPKSFWSQWQLRTAFAVAALVIVVGLVWLYQSRVRPPVVVATLKLTSSVRDRSEGAQARTIKLSPDAGALKVFLMLPNNAAPASRYRVELDTEDGATIRLPVAGQDDQSVSVVIPAAKLPPGQYALTLFALKDDGTEQPVYGSYIFTVE